MTIQEKVTNLASDLAQKDLQDQIARNTEKLGKEKFDELCRKHINLISDFKLRREKHWLKSLNKMIDLTSYEFSEFVETGGLHPDNKHLRSCFEQIHNLKLPKGVKATNEFLQELNEEEEFDCLEDRLENLLK